MILNRIGNKKYLAKHSNLLSLFPPHDLFIDMFFGAGGLFFSKPRAKYNICNDIDDEVFNLYITIREHKEEFIQELIATPIHTSLFKYWLKTKEVAPLKKAVRFIIISNFSLYGAKGTMKLGINNNKQLILDRINATFDFIKDVQFTNLDFKQVIKSIGSNNINDKSDRAFIYADPPYVGTNNNYSNGFSRIDTEQLFDLLVNSGIRFAISELDNPFILDLASKHNLTVINLKLKIAIKKTQREILIVNYDVPKQILIWPTKQIF